MGGLINKLSEIPESISESQINRRTFFGLMSAAIASFAGCALQDQTHRTSAIECESQVKSIDELQAVELTNKLRPFIYSVYDLQLYKEGHGKPILPIFNDRKEEILANIKEARKDLEQILACHGLDAETIISKFEKGEIVEKIEEFYEKRGLIFVSDIPELRKYGSLQDCYLEDKDIKTLYENLKQHIPWAASHRIPNIDVIVDTPIMRYFHYEFCQLNNKKLPRDICHVSPYPLWGLQILLYAYHSKEESADFYKLIKKEGVRFDQEIENPNLLDHYIKANNKSFYERIQKILLYKSLKPELEKLANEKEEQAIQKFHEISSRKYYTNILSKALVFSEDAPPFEWKESKDNPAILEFDMEEGYLPYARARAILCSLSSTDPYVGLAGVFAYMSEGTRAGEQFGAKFNLNKFKEILLTERDRFKDNINYNRYDKTGNELHLLKQFVRLNGEDIRYISNKVLKDVFKGTPIWDLAKTELKPM